MRKSLLKTIVAAAVVGATMALTSVAAWATDYVFTGSTSTTFYTAAGSKKTGINAQYNGTEYTEGLKLNSSGKLTFTTPDSGKFTVALVNNQKIKVGGVEYTPALSTAADGDTAYVVSVDLDADKTYEVVKGGSENSIVYALFATSSDITETEYTVTGSSNMPETKITVDGADVTTDADGNWTYTKTVYDSNAPFAVGDKLTVSLKDYTVSPEQVTLAAGTTDTSFTTEKVTFTKKVMGTLSAGVYTAAAIDAGLPNFDASAITFKSGTNFAGGKVNGTLKFKLDKAATVIISAKTGGSNAGTITIGNANSDSITDKSNFTNYFFENVAAGEVEVVFSGDSGVVVSTITVAGNIADTLVASPKGGDYYCIDATSTYIIHPVSEAELEYTSLAMSKGGAAVEATKTTEVYTSVQFADGSTVSAEDCGATYIYAVQVTGTNGAAPTTKYVWVDAN